jgi:hypothetical protein
VPRRIVNVRTYPRFALKAIYDEFPDNSAYHSRALSEQDFDRSVNNLQKSGMVREYASSSNVLQDLPKLTAEAI